MDRVCVARIGEIRSTYDILVGYWKTEKEMRI